MILHICGGPLQIPAIQWTRELGAEVALTDRDPKCGGRIYTEHFAQLSADDISGIATFAKSLKGLRGVYAGNDLGIPVCIAVNQMLKLPHCDALAACTASDKAATKKALTKVGIKVPQEPNKFPLVVKPNHGSGSCGVRIVERFSGLEDAIAEAVQFGERIILEEYIEGLHLDVNACFDAQGRFHPCGIAARGSHSHPHVIPEWGYFPSGLGGVRKRRAYETLEQAARAVGINYGPVKGDFIFNDSSSFTVLEIDPRFHGECVTTYLMPMATSDSPVKAWLRYLIKGGVFVPPNLTPIKGGVWGWKAILIEGAKDNRSVLRFEYAHCETLEDLRTCVDGNK